MDLIHRHRKLTILAIVLFAQMLGLAFQVKRPTGHGPERLIRLWAISMVTPVEQAAAASQSAIVRTWSDYFDLRGVRGENARLREENLRLRLEQVRMAEDAGQAQRLQALLKFKEQFISETIGAQVIGTSGVDTSRVIYIDKGSQQGVKPDMAVITPEGIVGKVINALPNTSQVLEINDPSSGVGVMLVKSRLQGILKGTITAETTIHYVMSDETVEPGELVETSGGDGIFPKGLAVGAVAGTSPGPETFLNIRVNPSARLDRLEEVLVISKVDERQRQQTPEAPLRAADILAQRLPGVPVKPPPELPAETASAPPAVPPASPPAAAIPAASPSAASRIVRAMPETADPSRTAAANDPEMTREPKAPAE